MMYNRKIKQLRPVKPIKFQLLFFLSFISFSLFGQSSFQEEIEKHREHYKSEFLKDKNSPLLEEDLPFLAFYEAVEKYKVTCKFIASKGSDTFEMPTSSGKTKVYSQFGKLKFKLNGKKQELTVYRSQALMNNPLYRDYLFIPFKDLSNGDETYGGGRYLDLRMKELGQGEITIDFNKAYNPYCVYALGYSCPIPPPVNHLDIAINAGEKNYLGTYKDME